MPPDAVPPPHPEVADPGAELLREVAASLNRDAPAASQLKAVADLLHQRWALRSVTIWRRTPRAGGVVGVAAPRQSLEAASLADLPSPPPGGIRLSVARAGHQLGVLDLAPGDRPLDPVGADTVAAMLAPVLDAQLLSEGLADELATRTREIQDQRRFTDMVIDTLPVGLYVVDRDYRVLVWNRKRETGTQGLRRDQVIGRRVFDVLTRQPAEQFRNELETIFTTGEVLQREQEVETAVGRRVFRITKIPMRMDGQVISHVITIGEDITERRAASMRIQQSEKLAALGQLAAGVMHEINNPLATIGACVAAIESRIPAEGEPAVAEYLGIIDTEVERCTGIVDQLLDFSRAKPDRSKRRPEDLNALVEQTLLLLKVHSRFKRLVVEREFAEPLPPVLVDGERVVQTFMAIMLNAADAMDRGGTLRVVTGPSPGRPDELVASIRDSGAGIAPADLPRIFEPFFTTKAPGRGTGLGLTIAYGIIEEQGGRITVDSEPGLGTTFRIFLPVAGSVPEAP